MDVSEYDGRFYNLVGGVMLHSGWAQGRIHGGGRHRVTSPHFLPFFDWAMYFPLKTVEKRRRKGEKEGK